MEKENKLPIRKHPRLEDFDYRSNGAYFITICTQDKRCVFSRIAGQGTGSCEHPRAESLEIEYTQFGKIAEKQLQLLEERYSGLFVDCYVIMPNHIHVILILREEAAGASPRPTIMDAVCAYKSLTTIECKRNGFFGKLFQTSFHDHVIRSREDYERHLKYVVENPMRWIYDELYSAL